MEQEYFKPINGFETHSISNYGNIKDLRNEKLVSQFVNESSGGYLQVVLNNPNGKSNQRVHRLMGLNTIDNLDNLEEIDQC